MFSTLAYHAIHVHFSLTSNSDVDNLAIVFTNLFASPIIVADEKTIVYLCQENLAVT